MAALSDEEKTLFINVADGNRGTDEDDDSTALLNRNIDAKNSINIDDIKTLTSIEKVDCIVNKFKIGFFHYLIVIICGFCYCSYTLFYQAISYIIVSVCDLRIQTQNQPSWLSLHLTIGVIVGSGIGGVIGDLFGRRIVILVALSINLLGIIATAFSVNLDMMIAFICFNGLAFGAMLSNIHPYSIEFFPRHFRGWAMACITAFSVVGSIYGSLVAMPLVHTTSFFTPPTSRYFPSWRLYLLSCCLPIIIGLCSLIWMPNSLRYTLIKESYDKKLMILNRIDKINSTVRQDRSNIDDMIVLIKPVISKRHNVNTDKNNSTYRTYIENIRQLNQPSQRRRILVLMTAWFGYGFTSHGLWVWLPSLLSYYFHGNNCLSFNHNGPTWNEIHKVPANISVCLDASDNLSSTLTKLMIGNILSIPVTLSCILIVNRYGRKGLFCSLAILSGISIILIWVIDQSVFAIILVCMFSAIAINGWIPLKVWSSELFATEIRSTTFGILNVFGHIGILCGTVIFTPLFYTSCLLCLILYSLITILSGNIVLYQPDTIDTDIG